MAIKAFECAKNNKRFTNIEFQRAPPECQPVVFECYYFFLTITNVAVRGSPSAWMSLCTSPAICTWKTIFYFAYIPSVFLSPCLKMQQYAWTRDCRVRFAGCIAARPAKRSRLPVPPRATEGREDSRRITFLTKCS